ncbi:MAG: HlyD family efflux transporter periplasmic adaptor subunit [Salinivirgaceae bacterium]|nr:HlyD family efflux transporter periplasmic adaptor subunit [Salinivirgaceae bacterium]
MDRVIEQKKGIAVVFSKKALPYWLGAGVVALVVYLLLQSDAKTMKVDVNTLTISKVADGKFDDYIRVSGQVQPQTTIQLSPLEGGVVERIVTEEGTRVKAGDPILILSNENLDMQILNSEAELAEKENMLRNTVIQMEQQRLSNRQSEIELGIEVKRNKRHYEQQKALYDDKLIAREEYTKAEEDYFLSVEKYELVRERLKQDSAYRSIEVHRLQESLENMQKNMKIIRRRKENLVIKAPIDGELGLLDAVLGQSIQAGVKIGQINSIGTYKIEAQIDEHYIDRVILGLSATFDRQGEVFNAIVRKVYPEVRSGKFQADFRIDGTQPANIRSGQTYYLNLQLGQSENAVIIPRGSFYQSTGGKWIFVVSPKGDKAVKREIRIGRQNPKYYEVLDGLEPGEKVITSSYESYGDCEVLVF